MCLDGGGGDKSWCDPDKIRDDNPLKNWRLYATWKFIQTDDDKDVDQRQDCTCDKLSTNFMDYDILKNCL